jgi:lipopolysaccharide export system permease protein
MQAELQWRISIVLMALVLSIVAVPLSRVNPRTGKFAKILPAIIIFLIYVGLLFIWRDKVVYDGWQGGNMLVVHLVIILLGIFLLWRQKRRLS